MSEIQKLTAAHEEELIQKLSELVRINSEESEPLADAPFGAGPRDALLAALAMMERTASGPSIWTTMPAMQRWARVNR